ncbi:proline--tRNA ligase [Sulfidibacter corallicola]|uniref:Proline--tRNA ligase n=1 Tax=Sulfidibacter corallicola TaxID=2818388 RepID=A0A8A4TSZ7_SULCO|nr:proline--tRNA ligase [Sulfidibacter corallicola]QTD52623.1 proline--tRNA ligase [Sulfidibacter corallicola]
MRRSRFLINTLKETPKEAVVVSHILMLRTCMIKQLASGIYTYMPLALRSLRKIENIIREELDAAGCQELLMPMVQPAELWSESGRWQAYGKELLRFEDRKDNGYCLGPTHEEVITDIARREIRSYRELPVNLYQIQSKFRDEIRPRFGLMRGREFIMKDAYSFDTDEQSCDESYWQMYEAYKRIFTRCGLTFRPVEADSGNIGGSYTHEFHVLAGSGEDEILSCSHCDYAANVERAELKTFEPAAMPDSVPTPEEVSTPAQKTIEAVAGFLGVKPEQCVKTLVYRAGDRIAAAALMGHRELNETTLRNEMGAAEIELVTDAATFQANGLAPGFMGPLDWPKDIPIYVDDEVMAQSSVVTAANKVDTHVKNVVPVAHFNPTKVLTLRAARAGDGCPRCGEGVYESYRGIEVGQVFKLGIKYSESMKAFYLDAEGNERPMVMGCYGIGVSRTMAAAIEQNHDKDGIIWPVQIAPFHVALLNLDIKDEEVVAACEAIESGLALHGVEVLVDDTANRPGPKFKDADLIGMPVQVKVGARSLKQGQVELKVRKTGERRSVALAEAVDEILADLKNLGWNSAPGQV